MLDRDKALLAVIIQFTDILEGTGTLSMKNAKEIRAIAVAARESMDESFERGLRRSDEDNGDY